MTNYDHACKLETKIEKAAKVILKDLVSYIMIIWPATIRVKILDRRWDVNCEDWKNPVYKISYNKREIAIVKGSPNAITEVVTVIKKHHDDLAAKYEQLHMKKAVKFADVRKLILMKMVSYCKEQAQKFTVDWNDCRLVIPNLKNDFNDSVELEISTTNDSRVWVNITINPDIDDSSGLCWNVESVLISDPNFDPDKIVGLLDLAIKKKIEYEQYYKKIFTDVNDFLGKTGCIDEDGGEE